MAENEKVTIEIETKAKLDGIKKTQDSVEELSETVKESKGIFRDFFENLKDGLKDPYVAWLGFTNAIKGSITVLKQGINFIAEGIKGYLEGERAVDRLTASYKALGIESYQAIKNAKDFAMEMRNATGITDDAFIDAQRLMANYGIVGQKAQEAIRAAYALAQGVGMSFESAIMQLARASVGATESLSRYGIVLGEGVKEGEKFEAVISQINERFGATAQASMGDMTTQVNALKENLDDFKELLVVWLVPALDLVIKKANQALTALNGVFGNDKSAIEQTVEKDKQRLDYLKAQHKIALREVEVFRKGSNDRLRVEQHIKDLENEMLKISSSINVNQQTLNKEKQELAAQEAEINANSSQITKNTLAAAEATKEQANEAKQVTTAKEKEIEAEKAKTEELKRQKDLVRDMGLTSAKDLKGWDNGATQSEGDLTGLEVFAGQSQLSSAADAVAQYDAEATRLEELRNLKQEYIEAEITDEALKQEALQNLNQQYTEQNLINDKKSAKARQQVYGTMWSALTSLATSENKKVAAVGKVASIAQATMSMFTGAAKALELPFPANLAAVATVLAQGAALVSQIEAVKLAKGGLVKAVTGGVPAVIGEGGSDEAVLPLDNSRAMRRIGGAIAEESESGSLGQALTVTVNINASGGLPAFLNELTEATQNGVTEALRYANVAVKAGNEQGGYSV